MFANEIKVSILEGFMGALPNGQCNAGMWLWTGSTEHVTGETPSSSAVSDAGFFECAANIENMLLFQDFLNGQIARID